MLVALAALCLTSFSLTASAASQATQDLTVRFGGVTAIKNVTAVTGSHQGEVDVTWNAPDYTGVDFPLAYDIRVATFATAAQANAINIANNTVFANAHPLSDFSTTTIIAVGSAGAAQSMTVVGLSSTVVYAFAIRAYDSGLPTPITGYWERNVNRNFNRNNYASAPLVIVHAPMAPFGVELVAVGTGTVTLSWLPTRAFADGTPFVSTNPASAELTGYRVYRASAPTKAPWTLLVDLSTYTLSFSTNTSDPSYHYCVKAYNTNAESASAMVRSHAGPAYIVGYDDLTTFELAPEVVSPSLNGIRQTNLEQTFETAYLVTSSSNTSRLGNGVLKSMEFKAWRAGTFWDPSKQFTKKGVLNLHYTMNGREVTTSGYGQADRPATVGSLSVFWYNGNKWVQLYGEVNETEQTMRVETPYLGKYELRSVERVGDFSFNSAGLSNKMMTPNGDGKNDTVVFFYNNPRASDITGRIFDMRGRHIADMTAGPSSDSLEWDGKSAGAFVPGGVYVYQIEGEGKTFRGTIVLVR